MKYRFWFALLLSAVLIIPAAAQQAPASPTSPDQTPAAQAPPSQTPDQKASDEDLSPRQPLQADTHQGFWGKLNPFARKKYVQRQLTPLRDRTNELDGLTAKNASDIKDADSRAQEGIRVASDKANQADQHAVDAGNRAQAANQTATQASARLQTVAGVVGNLDQYKSVSDVEIRFHPGQAVLSDKAKEALDQVAEPLKDQKGYIIQVQGFSAGRGQQAIENSRRMADAAVRYLVLNHDIPVYRIHVLGLGNAVMPAADGTKARRVYGGRVEVSLMKNDMEQLSSLQPATTALADGGSGAEAQKQKPAIPKQ